MVPLLSLQNTTNLVSLSFRSHCGNVIDNLLQKPWAQVQDSDVITGITRTTPDNEYPDDETPTLKKSHAQPHNN
jgi:hypothetical protein